MSSYLNDAKQQGSSITNFPQYPEVYHQFVTDTLATATSNGIKIRCDNNDLLYRGESNQFFFKNYFCPHRKEIALSKCNAGGVTPWMKCFIHESCHMDQWIQDRKFWNSNISGVSHYYDSLSYETCLSKKDIEKHTQNMINLELDCEKRTLEKIKKYDLPIDIKQYTREANAYLYGIVYAGKARQYIPFSYTHEIAPLSPDKFQKSYAITTLPEELFEAFWEYSLTELLRAIVQNTSITINDMCELGQGNIPERFLKEWPRSKVDGLFNIIKKGTI